MLVGATGGIDPASFLDPESKSEVRPEAGNKSGTYSFPQPAATPSTGHQFVAGFNSANGIKGKEDLALNPSSTDLEESVEKKDHSEEKSQGITFPGYFCDVTVTLIIFSKRIV